MFGPLFYVVLGVLSSFPMILIGKRELVLLMSCNCECAVALPHGDVGWSAVCGNGIS